MTESHPIPKFKCDCGYEMNMTTDAYGQNMPKPKDISLCFQCARIRIFNDDMTQRNITAEEEVEIQKSPIWPQLQRARDAILKKKEL